MANIQAHVLAYIRNQVGNFLTDTCTIKSETANKTTSYSPQRQYATVANNISCRVFSASSGGSNDAELYGDRQIVGQSYDIIMAYTQEMKTGYIIETGGESYNVVSIETQLTDSANIKVRAVKS
jgi:hypothetical protein